MRHLTYTTAVAVTAIILVSAFVAEVDAQLTAHDLVIIQVSHG
jgi:hypothetical protein